MSKVRDKPHKDLYHIDEDIGLFRFCWDIFPRVYRLLHYLPPREGRHLTGPEVIVQAFEGPGSKTMLPITEKYSVQKEFLAIAGP